MDRNSKYCFWTASRWRGVMAAIASRTSSRTSSGSPFSNSLHCGTSLSGIRRLALLNLRMY